MKSLLLLIVGVIIGFIIGINTGYKFVGKSVSESINGIISGAVGELNLSGNDLDTQELYRNYNKKLKERIDEKKNDIKQNIEGSVKDYLLGKVENMFGTGK